MLLSFLIAEAVGLEVEEDAAARGMRIPNAAVIMRLATLVSL